MDMTTKLTNVVTPRCIENIIMARNAGVDLFFWPENEDGVVATYGHVVLFADGSCDAPERDALPSECRDPDDYPYDWDIEIVNDESDLIYGRW